MPIDFESDANASTYATRTADQSWYVQMRMLLGNRIIGRVADIGCGGGIYSRAWKMLGADSVVGVDTAAPQIDVARAETTEPTVEFAVASAYETNLPDASCDIVFSRAVIHHLTDHPAAFAEAFRITKPGGLLVVQDRTIEDVLQPPSPNHFRAHFFSEFPRLLEDEHRRRPVTTVFRSVLEARGFLNINTSAFWETRTIYQNEDELRADLVSRTGRSILHELTDSELEHLTDTILRSSSGHYPLAEQDRWTMWTADVPES